VKTPLKGLSFCISSGKDLYSPELLGTPWSEFICARVLCAGLVYARVYVCVF